MGKVLNALTFSAKQLSVCRVSEPLIIPKPLSGPTVTDKRTFTNFPPTALK